MIALNAVMPDLLILKKLIPKEYQVKEIKKY